MKQRHEWAKRLSWFLLLLVLGLTFGWRVAALLLALWTIGYVAFWLFMVLKPVKQGPQAMSRRPAFAKSLAAGVRKPHSEDRTIMTGMPPAQ
jgi:small-conductance mechanosensitive channel